MSATPAFDAIVLAGGGGTRLGGADKAAVVVAGRPMLAHVLDAVGGASRTVVVGPPTLATFGVDRVQEDPPLGGPAAGVAAGLRHLGDGDGVPVLVVACDVPLAAPAVADLLSAVAGDEELDGAVVVDAAGRRQPLLAVYRRASLTAAVERLQEAGGVDGAPTRQLLAEMTLAEVPDRSGASRDGDTWNAVAELDAILTRRIP